MLAACILITACLYFYFIGYRIYANQLDREVVQPDSLRKTPAIVQNDGVDYVADLSQNGVMGVQKATFSNKFQTPPPNQDQHQMSAVEELFMNVTELNDAD